MIIICIAIVLGSAFAFWGGPLPDPLWFGLLPLLLPGCVLKTRYRPLCLFLGAFLWASLNYHLQLEKNLDTSSDGRVVLIVGVIADLVEERTQSIRFLIKPEHIDGYDRPLPDKIRLSWYRDRHRPQAGERWQLLVKLKKPSAFQNPGGFDYRRWLFVQGIGATGYVKQAQENLKLQDAEWWRINRYREILTQAIEAQCATCTYSGLYQALVTGYRGGIDTSHRQTLQESGTAHLLAISGLHIGFIAMLFFGMGRIAWRYGLHRLRCNRLECSASFAIIAAIMYSALAGFSFPTLRALIMLVVVLLALLLRRGVNLLNSIAIAVSLILIIDPLAMGSSSFWLSVSALLIIAFGQYMLTNQASALKRLCIIQLLFSLLFIPLTMLLFNQASPAGFLANIIAIPLLGVVVLPLVLLATLLAVSGLPITSYLFTVVDMVMSGLFYYLELLLGSGLAVYQGGDMPVFLLLCAAVGLLLFLLPVGNKRIIPALLLLLLPLLWHPVQLVPGDFRLTVLDVGMGTSLVIETRNHSLVYDFGPGNNQGFSAGDWVLKPYLRFRGIETADLMVISHVDQDHSGGFISFTDDFDPSRLLSGTPAELIQRFRLEAPVRSCHDYPMWRWDGVEFEFLSMSGLGLRASTNNRSCVLNVRGHQSVLISGDIEADREAHLVAQYAESLDSDILLAPHHGSLTSSTPAFVHQISPDVVIFTLGRKNRWGFPRAEVVQRYTSLTKLIYRTDQLGAIIVNSKAQGYSIDSYRHSQQHIWHR